MANTNPPCGKILLMMVKSFPVVLILWFLKGISLLEHFPKVATAILETVCDTLSATARLVGVSITLPRCLDRYSCFEQFPELPVEVQNMVFEAIGRTAKPHYPYRHGDNGDRRRCTGRDDCIARCNRSVRFSSKNDIFSVLWYDEDIDRKLDAGRDIPDRFCNAVPALADIERFAFLNFGPETWDEVYDSLVGYWPCHMPQLREIYLICTGHIEPIGSAALPAPFLESGGFKFTELDATKVLFCASRGKDENMAFDVVRRAQDDYDVRFDRLVTEEDRLPLEVRDDLPEEYSRRRVQVKVVHMGVRDTSLFRRYGTKTTVWACNKLRDFYLDAKKSS